MHFRLYIDEVGNGDLKGAATDINVRYLSLTGVLTSVDLHERYIQPRIDDLKHRYFGHTPDNPVFFHRRELVRREGPFSALRDNEVEKQFNEELLELFAKLPYLVITVQIDKKAHLETYDVWHYDPYHYCMKCIVERYAMYLRSHGWQGDVMVEARFKKVDKKLKASFERIYNQGTDFLSGDAVRKVLTSKDIQMSTKHRNVAGLQLADLIAHPSARYMRFLRDGITHPQDFGGKVVQILLERRYRRHPSTMKIDGIGIKWLP